MNQVDTMTDKMPASRPCGRCGGTRIYYDPQIEAGRYGSLKLCSCLGYTRLEIKSLVSAVPPVCQEEVRVPTRSYPILTGITIHRKLRLQLRSHRHSFFLVQLHPKNSDVRAKIGYFMRLK